MGLFVIEKQMAVPQQRWEWPNHVHGLLISRLLGTLFDGLSMPEHAAVGSA